MISVLFYVWKDTRVWAYWNYSFDTHLHYLGPVSCFSPSWIPLGVWLQWPMVLRLQRPLFTEMAGDILCPHMHGSFSVHPPGGRKGHKNVSPISHWGPAALTAAPEFPPSISTLNSSDRAGPMSLAPEIIRIRGDLVLSLVAQPHASHAVLMRHSGCPRSCSLCPTLFLSEVV